MKKIPGDKAIYEFTENLTPVEMVKSGETVIFEANDCFYQQLRQESATIEDLNMAHLNPAIGPVEIEGAEVGDLLAVTIEKIDLDDFGTALCEPGHGVLGSLNFNRAQRDIPIKDGYAIFSDEIKIPLNPMVGVIDVASKAGNGSWQNAIPWKHGGNMDTTALKGLKKDRHCIFLLVKMERCLLLATAMLAWAMERCPLLHWKSKRM